MNDAHYATGPQITVSNEAVQSFNLVQNQFSSEFGGGSGGVFNTIVKTGTNQIHGSLYEYMQNRDLNAVDQQEVQQGLRSNPRFDSNRFGGTIGGHIIKDKLFYFGNIEYNPLGQAAQPPQAVYAPTAAGISLLNGMSGLSKTNLNIFEKYVPVAPTADANNPVTVNGVNIPNGPLSFASPNYYNTLNIATSIDWNISTKDQLRGRYFYNRIAASTLTRRCRSSSRPAPPPITVFRFPSSTISPPAWRTNCAFPTSATTPLPAQATSSSLDWTSSRT